MANLFLQGDPCLHMFRSSSLFFPRALANPLRSICHPGFFALSKARQPFSLGSSIAPSFPCSPFSLVVTEPVLSFTVHFSLYVEKGGYKEKRSRQSSVYMWGTKTAFC